MEVENPQSFELFSRRTAPKMGNSAKDVNASPRSINEPESDGNSTWRGQGGGKTSLHSVQFDKQMDNISLWLEEWDHQTVSFQFKKLFSSLYFLCVELKFF